MKKLIVLALALTSFSTFAQKLITNNGQIEISSSSPGTDVEAKSKKLLGALVPESREFSFKVDMTSLDFPNDEMENHYNEKYLHTDKDENRYGTFAGKILGAEDFTKDGVHKVVAQGKFKIHNVTVDRNIVVTLKVVNGKINAVSEFYVPLKDHKIEVPTLVFAKIGENIKINVNIDFVPAPAPAPAKK